VRSIALVTIVAIFMPLSLWISKDAIPDRAEQQVCDVGADYFLGAEDYSEAIRRHVEVVRKYPQNALAHYHLGFALGMVGDRIAEVTEYRRAEALGLKSWDLFLNLGLAQLENGELDAATNSLQRSVLLGEDHPESHFNLALVDERRGNLTDAEDQTLVSLRLNPEQPDARNLLGVIYAQQGKTANASMVWSELVRDVPDFEPARTNLAILGNPIASGEAAAVDLPPAVAVNAVGNGRELSLPTGEAQLTPRPVRYIGR
jgi:Flp pilus assembly protein TadD